MNSGLDELTWPIPEGDDWWTSLKHFPTKIMDQHFGYELFARDLMGPIRERPGLPYPFQRNKTCIDNSGFSSVTFGDDFFEIMLQSEQFLAKDLKVNFQQNSVTILGQQDFRKEGDGMSYRSFERRFMLPMDVVVGNEECCQRAGDLLVITLRRLVQDKNPDPVN